MKILKKLHFFIALSVFFSILSPISVSALSDPDIQCGACVLIETNTGEIFYSKNKDEKMYPASTTKIMTVLLAVEAIERGEVNLSDMVTASYTSHNDLTPDSSTQNIIPGETMVLEDLLYCAMLASANEACNIIGEHVAGGNISDFIELMNERAKELGCKSTNFVNTHGLPDENHYTTAWELGLISMEAMRHPLFAEICSTVSREIAATNKSDVRYITNTNRLISSDRNSSYYYEYAKGVKTGSTQAAGYCLVSAAEKDGISLLSVVLKAQNVQLEDGSYQLQSMSESKRLFEWAFDNYSYKEILSTTELLASVSVKMGAGTDSVLLRPASSVTVLLPDDINSEDFTKDITIFYEDGENFVNAPINQNQVLGEIVVSKDGKNYAKVELLANTGVKVSKTEYLKKQIHDIFHSTWFTIIVIIVIAVIALYIGFVVWYNIRRKKEELPE